MPEIPLFNIRPGDVWVSNMMVEHTIEWDPTVSGLVIRPNGREQWLVCAGAGTQSRPHRLVHQNTWDNRGYLVSRVFAAAYPWDGLPDDGRLIHGLTARSSVK